MEKYEAKFIAAEGGLSETKTGAFERLFSHVVCPESHSRPFLALKGVTREVNFNAMVSSSCAKCASLR
jgi:hypothetical protein